MIDEVEDQRTEMLVMIDEFIQDISGKTLVETVVVIDRLLDMRNYAEKITVPN